MAELMAKGEPGPLAAEFSMWRFKEGQFIDESVGGRGGALMTGRATQIPSKEFAKVFENFCGPTAETERPDAHP